MADKQRKLTILQQRAQDAIITGKATNMTDACRQAGYAGNDNTLKQTAHHLLTNVNFMRSIEAKKAELAEKVEVTFEGQVTGLREVALLAKNEKDYTNYIAAMREIDKLAGLIVDKSQNTVTDSSGRPLTEEEQAIIRQAANQVNIIKARKTG